MAPYRDPVSVRTSRLNNLIIGKGHAAGVGVVLRASGRGNSSGGIAVTSSAFAEAIGRESLLDALCLLFNECDKDALKKRDRNISEFVNKFRFIIEEARQLRVNADDFTVKAMIGKGYFGNVHLVVERQTGDVYAMKKIKKSFVASCQVKEERDIMSRRCSEWITNLQYAFQDSDHLYLVMEFMPGGDLQGLMSRHGPFDEDLARFYLAEMTLAIHTLHHIGYVHRDIKPENILIDRFGHIKLTDFGSAATLDRDGHVMSVIPVGTPDYIAPELLQTISSYKLSKSIHDASCDFWSMGIIAYELICETTPFQEDSIHETYSKILSHCDGSSLKEIIKFPSDLKVSANYKSLIESLITNPTNRLGYDKIRIHPYFETIKWETIRSQVPPIIPAVNADDDISNFEETVRTKGRPGTFAKKSPTSIRSNDFSGKDLPFIGYSFVHMEKQITTDESASDDVRFGKLNVKLKQLHTKLQDRTEEIAKLKQELIRAEQLARQSDSQSKILQDAKEEIHKMQNKIKEKTLELASSKTQIKTLQSSVKIEAEMWEKKEATITELLRMNRQKYEEAKIASEQRYEKLIAEQKDELSSIVQKLDVRENELHAKAEECRHLQEKTENYKEMLRQFKEQAVRDKTEFEKNKLQLADTYEQKLLEMRAKLRNETDTKSRLTMELRDVRTELDDSINSSKSTQEAKNATAKSNDEILKRLNREIGTNNALHATNVQLEHKLITLQKELQEQQQEINRLERELQVVECGKNLAESALATQASPYETAPGSLTELHVIEEQLRADLETAKENEHVQKDRADKLQVIVQKLEEMIEKFNEHSPTKAHAAPGHMPTSVGDMLEKQNEKLEDKLTAVREQMIVERQAARSAHLSLWKTEKKLEETLTEKKMIERRMELTEGRIKRVQAERDEAQRLGKEAQGKVQQNEERIQELKDEIASIKRDVLKEHRLWEKAEDERMKAKSEIIEQIANEHKLKERISEVRQKCQQTQAKCDTLTLENKRLIRELNEERDKYTTAGDTASELQIQMKKLQDNYDQLKYACTITDNQLSEVEVMLEAEQKRNKAQQEKIDQLYVSVRHKDDNITQLKKDFHEEKGQRKHAQERIRSLSNEIEELKLNLQEVQKKLISQQQQLIEQTNNLFESQERVEVLTNETNNLQTANENHEREVDILKEENARILSDLFHSKEEAHRLHIELKEAVGNVGELQTEIDELQGALTEKQNYYLQRDIKAEATLAQHKKLIDYLQLKVEDLTQKKKKTLADMFFGSNTSSAKKENICPSAVESSILYRTLQEELHREKQRCKSLQEQVDKFTGSARSNSSGTVRSPLKNTQENENNKQSVSAATIGRSVSKSPRKKLAIGIDTAAATNNDTISGTRHCSYQLYHRFELSLQETNSGADNCIACSKPIVAGSPYWKCKECKSATHRKCRSNVSSLCGGEGTAGTTDASGTGKEMMLKSSAVNSSETESDFDTGSISKYSYEGKLDAVDGDTNSNCSGDYIGTLVFSMEQCGNDFDSLDINCAYEMEEQSILLLGCKSGLYAYHVQIKRMVHIAGIDSVSYIAISLPLAKAILVGSSGESLYQCDFRQLLSRSQSNACVKPALEASVLDLPFANRASSEKWQLVKISNEAENALDSVAVAATSTRIVILKYDLKMQKFKPVRALDTATPVSSILFTRHTAIVSSDKFFEIDLNNYAAEEFVDLSHQSLSHTRTCQPVVAIRITRREFLLCFMECGVFVDEYGCRSRPYDLNWEYTPTGFLYREPILYIAHFQSVQVLRMPRSYSKDFCSDGTKDADADIDESLALKRTHLSLYMPTLLAESGKLNAYILAIQKDNGLQQIYHLDAFQTFKQKLNESLETISSVTTSITMGSMATTDST